VREGKKPADKPQASTTDLKDLFTIFPDLPWSGRARPEMADQILIARWRVIQSRRARLSTLAANETMAALVRLRRT
jgi:hypothetical protein